MIVEDTVWSSDTLNGQNSIALQSQVVLFPGVTLTIEGRNDGNNHTTEAFVVLFLADVSITLQGGSRIQLYDVDFRSDTANASTSMGRGVETLGDNKDHQEGTVVLARRFVCQGLVSCFTVAGLVDVSEGSFYVDGVHSRAFSAYSSKVERCSFYNSGASSGIVPGSFYGRLIEMVDSKFISTGNLTATVAVSIYEYSSIKVSRTIFVGYQSALRAGGEGYDDVQNCSFVGNTVAFHGGDRGYNSRGTVQNSFFWRNGLAQSKHEADGNVYVENGVAYLGSRSATNLFLYRNLIGFWTTGTYEDLVENVGRKVANLTFQENVVSLFEGAPIPAGGSVNFIDSTLYHVNYTDTSPANLTSGVFWGSNEPSETQVREKIRDGFHNGGGPGFVLLNVTTSPLTPYLHPNFPSSDHKPPSLKEWMGEAMQLSDNIHIPDPPLPDPQKAILGLPLPTELQARKFSDWWDAIQNDNNGEDQGRDHTGCDTISEDPSGIVTATIVDVRTETTTCDKLAFLSWCSLPGSNAATICPRTCCDAETDAASVDAASVDTATHSKPGQCSSCCTGVSPPNSSWQWMAVLVVYLAALHVMACRYLCLRWQSYALIPMTDSNDDAKATSFEDDGIQLQPTTPGCD